MSVVPSMFGLDLNYASTSKDKFEVIRKISKKVLKNQDINNQIGIIFDEQLPLVKKTILP